MREDGARNEKFESNNDVKHLLNCMFQAICCEILHELIQLIPEAILWLNYHYSHFRDEVGSRLELVSEKNRKTS